MEAPLRPHRAVSILGHPVTGLAPIAFLSAGWAVLATQALPRLREAAAAAGRSTGIADLAGLWPFPPENLMFTLGALASLFIGIVLFLVWVRSAGGFGPLSDRLLHRRELLAAFVLLAGGVLTAGLIARGDPVGDGIRSHVAPAWLWQESIRAGTYPLWCDLWYGGFPVDQHFPPLSHILQALIGFLRFDPFTSAKVLAWFCRIAGAVGFALFCARVHRDQRSGLLGGILYALAPNIQAAWIAEGRMPGLLILALVPWVLLAGERLATGIGGSRSGAALALGVGALVMSHAGEARWALVLVGLFMLLRAIPTVATRGARAPSIWGILIGVLGGAALAAGFVVPLVRDAHLLNDAVRENLMGFTYRFPALSLLPGLFLWSGDGTGYLGLSIALLAILGIARAGFDRKEQGRGIGPVPLLLILVLPWFLVPTESPGPDLVFLGAQIAAAGVVRRPPAPRFRWIPRRGIYPVALLLVLLDLAPISLSTSYDLDRSRGGEWLYATLERLLPNGRFLELPVDREGRATASHRRYAAILPVPSVGGPYIWGAPQGFAYQAAMIDTVAHALARDGSLSRGLADLLAFHNVRYLVLTAGSGPIAPADPQSEGVEIDPQIPALRIDGAAPVVIIQPGTPAPPEPARGFVGREGLPPRVSADLARAQLSWLAAARLKVVREARAVVLPNRLEVEVPDLGPVEVRIARNSYPHTDVFVDGQRWSWREGPLGGIALVLEAGPHRIEVRATEEPLRRGLRIAQWVLAGLLFLVSIGPHRR